MAQNSGPTRNLLQILFKTFVNSLKPRKFSGDFRGIDYYGNKYYEIPADPSVGRRKASRWFEPEGGEKNFDSPLPAEWEAWLRGRRKEPPSEEELAKNLAIMEMKKKNAVLVDAKGGQMTPLTKGMESFPKRPEYEIVPGHTKKVE